MSFVSRRGLRLAYEDCIKKKRGTVNAIDFEVNKNKLYFQHYSKGVPFIGFFIH